MSIEPIKEARLHVQFALFVGHRLSFNKLKSKIRITEFMHNILAGAQVVDNQ